MRPMTNDLNILRLMLHQTGDKRLVTVIRRVKRFQRKLKRQSNK